MRRFGNGPSSGGAANEVAGREVERLMRKQVCDATRDRYLDKQVLFVCYLFDVYERESLPSCARPFLLATQRL
jgi:hypothetical protein